MLRGLTADWFDLYLCFAIVFHSKIPPLVSENVKKTNDTLTAVENLGATGEEQGGRDESRGSAHGALRERGDIHENGRFRVRRRSFCFTYINPIAHRAGQDRKYSTLDKAAETKKKKHENMRQPLSSKVVQWGIKV